MENPVKSKINSNQRKLNSSYSWLKFFFVSFVVVMLSMGLYFSEFALNFSGNNQLNKNQVFIESHEEEADDFESKITYERLKTDPEVRVYYNILKEGEAEELIKLGSSRLKPATVMLNSNNSNYEESEYRNNDMMTFDSAETPLIFEIEQRVVKLLNITYEKMESFQLLKYSKGHQFRPHTDWFTDEQLITLKQQRDHTLLIYLNDLPFNVGGSTTFQKLGISVHPKKNTALYFYNLYPNKTGNFQTIHSGDKILRKGVIKWVLALNTLLLPNEMDYLKK